MAGYASRLIHIPFPELSEDPDTDPIFVTIRNPRLMPMGELQPEEPKLGEDGQPVAEKGIASMAKIIARLVVIWRVYDATHLQVNPATGEPMDQPLLPLPATPDLVAKLPSGIVNKLADELSAAVNPK